MPDTVTLPTIDDAVALGLTRSEYELIVDKLGRAPNQVELAMFSLLWSEHCAYKHSRKLLRTLPTEGPSVLMGPGENAGAVDVGSGLAVAFKVESHNHPSAGDPFEEKKLLECCLELLDRGLLESLQDLGAAGLSSSSSEMASKGGVGIDIDVARVPLREPGMEPFEVMVSESQERMLCVVEPAAVATVLAACERWEIGGAAIGSVTASGRVQVLDAGRLVGDMPVAALVEECPLYDLQPRKPARPLYAPERARLGADAAARE